MRCQGSGIGSDVQVKAPAEGCHDLEDGHMEPLNLLVSLSHFGDTKPVIPPKQPKQPRRRKTATPTAEQREAAGAAEQCEATGAPEQRSATGAPEQRAATAARRAFQRIRTAVAR
jgi:hypothetical protein